jgi:hypothetical protein
VKGWGKDKARYILSEKAQVRKREQKKLLKIWPKLARMIVTMFLTVLHLNTILWYQTSLIACRLVKIS